MRFLRLIGDIYGQILGLVLGVPLKYYSEKLARLRDNEFVLFAKIITACQCKGAQ